MFVQTSVSSGANANHFSLPCDQELLFCLFLHWDLDHLQHPEVNTGRSRDVYYVRDKQQLKILLFTHSGSRVPIFSSWPRGTTRSSRTLKKENSQSSQTFWSHFSCSQKAFSTSSDNICYDTRFGKCIYGVSNVPNSKVKSNKLTLDPPIPGSPWTPAAPGPPGFPLMT